MALLRVCLPDAELEGLIVEDLDRAQTPTNVIVEVNLIEVHLELVGLLLLL